MRIRPAVAAFCLLPAACAAVPQPAVVEPEPPRPTVPPPAMPPPPPEMPSWLRGPEPALQSTGDPRVDAYRDRILAEAWGDWRPYLLRAFDGVRADPAILAANRAIPRPADPAEWVRLLVTDQRVEEGRKRLLQTRASPAYSPHNVPPQIVLAIWGSESDYGTRPAAYDPIQTWLMLGAYGLGRYREAFDLHHAVHMIAQHGMSRERMRAHGDGTLGQVGFYPPDYLRFARSPSGQRFPDIWGDRHAMVAAIVWRLQSWVAGIDALVEVEPPRLDPADPAHARQIRTGHYDPRLLRRIDGKAWDEHVGYYAGPIWAPFGADGPHFLRSQNFNLLWQTHPAVAHRPEPERDGYALAIALLAQRIAAPLPPRPM